MPESPVWSSPVLRSVRGVVDRSRHVHTSVEAIEQVASWMAFEEFAFPSGPVDGAFSERTDPAEIIDVSFFYAVMNFAFTDFDSGVKFAADYRGRTWSDSEGMFACVTRALADGGALASDGAFAVADLDRMTAFADYIVPVALRLMGILSYSAELEAAINRGELIPADSPEEVEIRAHTLYATALLTDAINQIRPPSLALVVPQVDFRLWKAYHATIWPHHLTRTIMY